MGKSSTSFKKGWKGGPGRPRKRTEEQYLNATINKVLLGDWGEVVMKALEDAKMGDDKARKFLANYLMGMPEKHIDHTTDGEKLNTIIQVTLSDD